MKKIIDQIYVGSKSDLPEVSNDFVIIHACKTSHKELLKYTGRSCSQDHPEYFIAVRGKEIFLNTVDTKDPKYFSKEHLIEPTLKYMTEQYLKKQNIFIHCDKGFSRAPSLAFLFLFHGLKLFSNLNIEEALKAFQKDYYPHYKPNNGIYEFILSYEPTPHLFKKLI